MQILSNLSLYGTLGLNSVADANTDTDKFLVIDSNGIVKYRTGQELYNDIGAGGAASYTSTLQHEVKAGVALNKGQAVYVTSADGTNMIVSKASNASEATSSKTLGLIAQNLNINGKGYVITEGLLSGLNTMAAGSEGDPVWLGTDGNLIYGLGSKPYAPDHLVFIGIVTRRNANNGEIFVKIQNGFELQELHNVQITSTPSDNAVLAYETSTSLYKMKSISTLLGYTPTTNARTLTINGTSYDLSADRSWSVGTHTGNLTTGYVPKATGATTLTDSLIYDNGSAIGINTNAPYESSAFKLDVDGGVLIKNTKGVAAQLILINSNPATGGNNGFVQLSAGGNTSTAFGQWQTYYGLSIASGALRLQPLGGQVLIGTSTTSAFTTDINGTLRVSGQLTLGSTITNGTYTYTLPGASGTLALASSLSSYVPTSRTLTINGTTYDLSADRSWTIATGVSSVQAGSGISVSTSSGVVTVTNTGLLSGTAGSGISVSTSGQNLNIVNTGLLSGTAGSGISVSTSGQNLNIVNTGLLSATAGSGISVSTSSQNVNIVNTGLLSATAGTGISVSTSSGVLTVTNTITNNNQLTNGAGYLTGTDAYTKTQVDSLLSGYLPLSGGTMTGQVTFTTTNTPFSFQNNGNIGTFTQTTIYTNQNNTSGSNANGIFIERGYTDISNTEVRKFVIGARGGTIQWMVDGTGYTTQYNSAEVKPSGDGNFFIGRHSGNSSVLFRAYQGSGDGYLELRTGANAIVTLLSGYTGTPNYTLAKFGIGKSSGINYMLDVDGGSTTSPAASFVKQSYGAGSDGIIARFINNVATGYSSYIFIGSDPGTDWKIGKNISNPTVASPNFEIVDSSNILTFKIAPGGAINFYNNTTINTTSGNGLSIITNDVATLKMRSTGGTKNWGFATTNLAASDFGIYQSTSGGGDPISAGTPILYFSGAGAAVFSNTLQIGASQAIITPTNFGYSSSYKVLALGTGVSNTNISLNYDPSGNASGSFNGTGQILIAHSKGILAPNAANNDFIAVLRPVGTGVYFGGGMSSGEVVGNGLFISTSGAATFSSSVTAGGSSLFSSSNTLSSDILTVRGGGASGAFGFKIEAANGEDIFYTDNYTYNVIANPIAGKFGIGTTLPTSLFHAQTSGLLRGRFYSTANASFLDIENASSSFYIGTDDSTGTQFGKGGYSSVIWRAGAYPIIIATNDVERMRISSAGNFDYGGFQVQSSNNSVYRQAFWGAMSIMWRNAEDFYIDSNHTYSSSSTNVASYTSANGIGRLGIAGGTFEWGTYDGSVNAGSAYALTARFSIAKSGAATFSSSVTAQGMNINGASDAVLSIVAPSSTAYVSFRNVGGKTWGIGNSFVGTNTNFQIYNLTDNVNALSFAAAGAATFSSSVTSTAPANALLYQFNGRSSDNMGQLLFYANNGSTLYSFMTSYSSEFILGTVTSIQLGFYTNNTERMKINSSGDLELKGRSTTANFQSVFYNANDQLAINATNTSTGKIINFNPSNSFTALSLSATGEATFSSNVTISSSFPSLILSRAGTTFQQDIKFQDAGSNRWSVGQAVNAVGNTLDFYSYSYGQVLGLNYSTGAAIHYGKTNIVKSHSDYAFTVVNTDTSGYGIYLQAGGTNNPIDVYNAAGTTQIFKLTGTGGAMFNGQVIFLTTASPFTFQNNGNTGTYTQTTIYANQTNTSGDVNNGIFIERGYTNTSNTEVRHFVIGARGGTVQWKVDGSGYTTQYNSVEVKPSGDGNYFIGRYSGGSATPILLYQSGADGYMELRTGANNIVTKLSGYTGTPNYTLANFGMGISSGIDVRLVVDGGVTTGSALRVQKQASQGDGVIAYFVNNSSGGYSSYIYIGSNPGTDWKIGKNILNPTLTNYHFEIVDSSNNLGLRIENTTRNATFGASVTATQFSSNGGRGADYGYKLPDWQIYNTSSGNNLAFSNYTVDFLTITGGGNYQLRNTVYSTSTDVTTTTYRQLYPSGYNIAEIAVRTDGQFYTGAFSFRTADASNANVLVERMRISSDGKVGINGTSLSHTFYVNGTSLFGAITVGSLGTGALYSNSGFLTNTNPSDFRLKNTIKPLTYGLNEVIQLNPKTFYYNDDISKSRLKYGFIAQEVKEVMPELARKLEGSSDYLGLETEGIWVTLVNAIKEQQAQIEELKSQLNK
jgi:predicted heme/steroid binding protein